MIEKSIYEDAKLIYDLLPKNGKSIGNTMLKNILKISEQRINSAKQFLLNFEFIISGRGRGGSVKLNLKNLNKFEDLENGLFALSNNIQNKSNQYTISERNNLRKVYAKISDLSISELYNRWKSKDLNLQPNFQRYSVWDIKKKSRLIESALLKIPLPTIYLCEELNGKESVIDGQQRLTAFFDFIDNKFALKNLEEFTNLNNKKFQELDDNLKRNILRSNLHTIIMEKEADENLKYEIFERLNTGAVALNAQELRNCIYIGKYSDLLKDMPLNKNFMSLLGLTEPHNRMQDVELALYFSFVFHNKNYFLKPTRLNLNREMKKYKDINDEEIYKLKNSFNNSFEVIKNIFGDIAFRKFNIGTSQYVDGKWIIKKNIVKALFDLIIRIVLNFDNEKLITYKDQIREAYLYLLTEDDDFMYTLKVSSLDTVHIQRRYNKFHQLISEIFSTHNEYVKYFSYDFKKNLLLQNQTCYLCNKKISFIDDAVIYNIPKYWLNEESVLRNSYFTHRYCKINNKNL